MLVKTATIEDANTFYALLCEYRQTELPRDVFDMFFTEALNQSGRRILLASSGTDLLGFADTEVRNSLSECTTIGVIHDFFVREPSRRSNVGGGMLLSVTTYFKTSSCSSIRTSCQRVNFGSQEFLEKRGFTKAKHYFIRNL